MNQDCLNCKSVCCMAGKSYSAVMSEREMQALRSAVKADKELLEIVGEDFSYYDETAHAYKMRKLEDDKCVFWNSETYACRVYDIRPLDCKIFPREYRWFRWMHSPQCPSKNFKKSELLTHLKSRTPSEIRTLKKMHILTPESTKDKIWIFLMRSTPIAKVYVFYAFIFDKTKKTTKIISAKKDPLAKKIKDYIFQK